MAGEIPDVLEPFGSCLYHYTTLEKALEAILPYWTIRMSPCSKMRDPRESGALLLTVSGFEEARAAGAELDDETFRSVIGRSGELFRLGHGIKDLVKILSLTADHRSPRASTTEILDRGFAHPRLWEQYGGAHRGVCICFGREALRKAVTDSLQRRGFGKPFYDDVKYRDGAIASEALEIRLEDVQSDGEIQGVLDAHIQKHRGELFFTKLLDWETEREFRFVITSNDVEPVDVPIHNTVRAVILGQDVPSVYRPALAALCDEGSVEMLEVRWTHGIPRFEDTMPPAPA